MKRKIFKELKELKGKYRRLCEMYDDNIYSKGIESRLFRGNYNYYITSDYVKVVDKYSHNIVNYLRLEDKLDVVSSFYYHPFLLLKNFKEWENTIEGYTKDYREFEVTEEELKKGFPGIVFTARGIIQSEK